MDNFDKKLIYLSRRSIRELDFLVEFSKLYLQNISESERAIFSSFLDLDDSILLSIILSFPNIEDKYKEFYHITEQIRIFLDNSR